MCISMWTLSFSKHLESYVRTRSIELCACTLAIFAGFLLLFLFWVREANASELMTIGCTFKNHPMHYIHNQIGYACECPPSPRIRMSCLILECFRLSPRMSWWLFITHFILGYRFVCTIELSHNGMSCAYRSLSLSLSYMLSLKAIKCHSQSRSNGKTNNSSKMISNEIMKSPRMTERKETQSYSTWYTILMTVSV